MLEILPIRTDEEQKVICNALGTSYTEKTYAYAAMLDEKPIALCRFVLTDDLGEIVALDSLPTADYRTLFLLVRSTLSFIELCGKDRAFFLPEKYDDKLIEEIGFAKAPDGTLKIDLI